MQNKYTISNLLIFISLLITAINMFFNNILIAFGINHFFLESGYYYIIPLQFIIGTFLHGSVLHLLFNSVFIYYFGNIVEYIIGFKKFLALIIFSTFFIGFGLLIFTDIGTNTIGISGVAMALLTYYTIELRFRNNPEYVGGVTAIIINIIIGFTPGISMEGHILGMISGAIFYFMINDILGREQVGSV